jgi:hypothetical protein
LGYLVFLSEADEGGLVLDVVLLDVLPEPVNFSLTFLVQFNLGARFKNFFFFVSIVWGK